MHATACANACANTCVNTCVNVNASTSAGAGAGANLNACVLVGTCGQNVYARSVVIVAGESVQNE
jgi:hypothetical protein